MDAAAETFLRIEPKAAAQLAFRYVEHPFSKHDKKQYPEERYCFFCENVVQRAVDGTGENLRRADCASNREKPSGKMQAGEKRKGTLSPCDFLPEEG